MDTSVMPLDENDKPMIDEPMKLLASDYGHLHLVVPLSSAMVVGRVGTYGV